MILQETSSDLTRKGCCIGRHLDVINKYASAGAAVRIPLLLNHWTTAKMSWTKWSRLHAASSPAGCSAALRRGASAGAGRASGGIAGACADSSWPRKSSP